jgi:hypothetical protein
MPTKRKPSRPSPKAKPPKLQRQQSSSSSLLHSQPQPQWPEALALATLVTAGETATPENQDVLHRAVETAAVVTLVWPALLLSCSTNRSTSTSTSTSSSFSFRCSEENHSDKHQQQRNRQLSLLLAQLVSWEHRQGVKLDTSFPFLDTNSKRAWETVGHYVFTTLAVGDDDDPKVEDDDWDRLATATHFMTVVVAASQLSTTAVAAQVLGPTVHEHCGGSAAAIWYYLPTRTRELLVRQQQQQQQQPAKIIVLPVDFGWNDSNKKPAKNPPFIVTVVQRVLHLVRGYGLALRAVATSKTRTTTIRNREGSVDDADLHHHHHHPAQWNYSLTWYLPMVVSHARC